VSTGAVISVEGLRKSYGQVDAMRGIDLEVGAGEIFAFLGPNGAGRTTTCEICWPLSGTTSCDRLS
jgi:ABC-2 type transport system ATP-binding protein